MPTTTEIDYLLDWAAYPDLKLCVEQLIHASPEEWEQLRTEVPALVDALVEAVNKATAPKDICQPICKLLAATSSDWMALESKKPHLVIALLISHLESVLVKLPTGRESRGDS